MLAVACIAYCGKTHRINVHDIKRIAVALDFSAFCSKLLGNQLVEGGGNEKVISVVYARVDFFLHIEY
jgi:hypothetical protein